MNSWQTTVAGLGMIAGAVVLAITAKENDTQIWIVVTTLAAGGIGLMRARDNSKTSEKACAK